MTWMQRLKRVFAVDIDTCQRCGGPLKVVASIEGVRLVSKSARRMAVAMPMRTPALIC